jgi:Lon protease-like protein
LLPLHIFEPRYRQLVGDALESDQLITMVLSKPSPVANDMLPPIFDVGCIGSILHREPLPDGRSNVVLRGLRRVHIDREIQTDRLYRMAQVSILHEQGLRENADEAAARVMQALMQIIAASGRASDAQKLAFAHDMPPDQLCDLASHLLSFDVVAKQSLLAELDVANRIDSLLAWMTVLRMSLERGQFRGDRDTKFSQN